MNAGFVGFFRLAGLLADDGAGFSGLCTASAVVRLSSKPIL